jgi:hypothetical protein
MATARERAGPPDFRYEPSYPPTIPPGVTVASYGRRRAQRAGRQQRRSRRR